MGKQAGDCSAADVQTVAICGYIEPLSAVVFSMLFLKEAMLPIQMLGAVCIIGGAIGELCIYKKEHIRINSNLKTH